MKQYNNNEIVPFYPNELKLIHNTIILKNFFMKKTLLTLALVASSMSVFAQEPTVLFSEDFEWLAPWATAGDNKGKPAGKTVETNDPNVYAPQLGTPLVEGVSVYQALLDKGYEILATCASSKKAREPKAQTYLQTNYLKFGLTGYYSGIVMPLGVTEEQDACKLNFDWCSMRQGSGKWDPTEIVVILKNGETETQFPVAVWALEDNAEYKWEPVEINIPAGLVKKDTKIIFRNCDAQWPVAGSAPALRWFLDNVKLTAGNNAVNDIIADGTEAAPVYYNLQGIQVENPAAGNLYIVRQGNKVTKQIVK